MDVNYDNGDNWGQIADLKIIYADRNTPGKFH